MQTKKKDGERKKGKTEGKKKEKEEGMSRKTIEMMKQLEDIAENYELLVE